ncbi:multidrug effflux MFS transporter [Luteimicrobium subarcticum]|uniref:DHA1 family bicyclomycin/chloramphenicol resistance-like MFS transporter n=1 Tax=Luteimicrobium subarcticum TaxID=620910 RepID=A0A2M8WUI5_9MICO|nr:multidrug effflux MFS transporter [Luteimicrobium subarcticum]PJI94559.1 DHA1 family bicyclomycin/chloramphenicol resistance-like MFS transporter [Luteimicrobium subarcticum]
MTDPHPAAARGPRSNVAWILLLGALAALPAFTTDMYLPTLPDVGHDLHTTDAGAQLTMSAMLIGSALGTLVIGPLSDRFGRRPPLLVGLAGHVVTSLLCVVAPTIGVLVGLRTVQGMFNAACAVTSMAIIRDRFAGADAARMLSRLMLVIGLSPLLAPTIGSLVEGFGGWRGTFVVLAGMGVVLAVVVWRVLPETLAPERRTAGGIGTALRGYRTLVRDTRFLALASLPGFGMAVVLSYVSGSPFVFKEGFGLSSAQFSLLFAINGVALVASAQVNAALVHRVAPIRLLRTALVVQMCFAAGLVVLTATGAGGILGVLVGLWLVLAFQGMVPSNASALALTRHGEMAGTASAVIGALQTGIAGVISPLVGVFGATALAMSSVMAGSIALALIVLAVATPAFRRGGGFRL